MEKIVDLIQKYDQIAIYRHVNPDLDAFGSQYGVYWTLKNSFSHKNIVLMGNMEHDLSHFYTQENEQLCDEKTLGIILDTANHERIDGDYSFCDKIIKIDHHIVVDSYGDINVEITSASSCSEIITLMMKEFQNDLVMPLLAAHALYLGIVGDSNRFLYDSTSVQTFEAASYLLEKGVDINALYQSLYLRKRSDIEVIKFIYNHYEQYHGIAYYYLSQEDLNELHMSREQGSSYVNTLSNIEEYPIWMAITENDKEHNYRVSIRSRQIPINDVASVFRGGGHAYASGATLESLEELQVLLDKLKEKING